MSSLISAFIGFSIGRFCDKYGGHLNTLHHWIYGLLMIMIGAYCMNYFIGLLLFSFGIGLFVSDLDDFLHLRFFGVDKPHKWKFWDIK
jgi:putative Mn2+ efflux pump MntP